MKKLNSFKILSSLFICAVFLLLAFGSDKQNDDGDSSETTTSSNKKTVYVNGYEVHVDTTCPDGMKEGSTCSACDGGSVIVDPVSGQEQICASCNGRGFNCN